MILIVRGLIVFKIRYLQKRIMPTSYSTSEKKLLLKVGKRIRKLRLDACFSQEKLAFVSELDRTYIGSVERGERNISVINLHKISVALNVDSFELLK